MIYNKSSITTQWVDPAPLSAHLLSRIFWLGFYCSNSRVLASFVPFPVGDSVHLCGLHGFRMRISLDLQVCVSERGRSAEEVPSLLLLELYKKKTQKRIY